MNDRDVRALGWLVTRDLLGDVLRRAIGRYPPASPAAQEELRQCWCTLVLAVAQDRRDRALPWVGTRSVVPLSRASESALLRLAEHLEAAYPGRYRAATLKTRFVVALGSALTLTALGWLLAWSAVPGDMLGPGALFVFAAAAVEFPCAIQVRRVGALMEGVLRKSPAAPSGAVPIPPGDGAGAGDGEFFRHRP